MEEYLEILWAKKDRENPERSYPLIFHMLDTSAVVRELWNQSLHLEAERFLSSQLGIDKSNASERIAFWAGLHDLGKASPVFQCQDEGTKLRLRDLGFSSVGLDLPHGTITAYLLKDYLKERLSPSLAGKIATAVGGHHGTFPQSADINHAERAAGQEKWQDVQSQLYSRFTELSGVNNLPLPTGDPSPAFFIFLAGLTSVADWIASVEDFFPYEIKHNLEHHPSYAREKALVALDKLGWTGWNIPPISSQFGDLFKDAEGKPLQPRPLQLEAMRVAGDINNQPGLVIIESPMGEGKTEAAMYLADSWVSALGQKGCYFALPTMATSDQMFERVKDFIKNRYKDERINLMLLHGHAALSAEFDSLLRGFKSFELQDVVASEWFTYKKRGLLAPFGVGTVDQALMAVLQTRHVFVRLFGLADKTVIIDEVHAYDAYMTTLMERLLEWLAALGSSVILLSATLPRTRRNRLLEAYSKGLTQAAMEVPVVAEVVPYPRISWANQEGIQVAHMGTSPTSIKTLRIKWADGALPPEGREYQLGRLLQEELSGGGCAAVICNTVELAQQVYSALKKYFPDNASDDQPELDLLHARYLYGDRQKREKRTLRRFGKRNVSASDYNDDMPLDNRPKRAVLVATQVIEQSLDIDFDLMITEMAPVDLLLQRAGRMHRHKERDAERPPKLKEPNLWICQPEMKYEIPCFGGGTEAVYDYHVLLRSWLAIKGMGAIGVPEEVEELIESVYDDNRQCPGDLQEELKKKWAESANKLQLDRESEVSEAQERWIKHPWFSQELWQISSDPKEEDNPELHQAHQALTRLTGLTVNVLCVFGDESQPYLDLERSKPIDNKKRPDKEKTKELLMHAVSVSRRGLVKKIIETDRKIPVAWREEPLLRHHYVLFFDDKNQCQFDKYRLSLDHERGLIIEKIT